MGGCVGVFNAAGCKSCGWERPKEAQTRHGVCFEPGFPGEWGWVITLAVRGCAP